MTNDTWWMPAAVGIAWVVGVSTLAALVALAHNLKRQLRVERRSEERARNRTRTSTGRSAARTLLVALVTAFALHAQAPMADDREAYLRASAQRDVAMFDALDRDRDGRLTMEEARGTIDIEARFTDFDIDRDGVITRAELVRYVALQYGIAVAP